jgi:hypothetical protein
VCTCEFEDKFQVQEVNTAMHDRHEERGTIGRCRQLRGEELPNMRHGLLLCKTLNFLYIGTTVLEESAASAFSVGETALRSLISLSS